MNMNKNVREHHSEIASNNSYLLSAKREHKNEHGVNMMFICREHGHFRGFRFGAQMSRGTRGHRRAWSLSRPLSPVRGERDVLARLHTPSRGASGNTTREHHVANVIIQLTKRRINPISLGCGCQPFKFRVTVRVTLMAKIAPALGPYSRRNRLAMLDGRTREARALQATIVELSEHVGGNPSATQARQIARAARLELHMIMMDARSDQNGGVLSDCDARQYLAWNNSFRLILRDLGLERRGPRQPGLVEALGQEAVA